MSRPVVVLSALRQERTVLSRMLDSAATERLLGQAVVSGFLGGRSVVVAEVGVGKVNAASQVALLIDRHRPRLVMFTGVAGALDPSLEVGDVVVASDILQHDAGVHEPDGFLTYQPGHVPFFNPTDRLGHVPSAALLVRAREATRGLRLPEQIGPAPSRVVFGRILSGDSYIHSPSVRVRLHEDLGGLAVEMEGGAVAQTAQRMGVDWLVVRAVSDLAGEDSGRDFTRFLQQVAANSAAVVSAVLAAEPD